MVVIADKAFAIGPVDADISRFMQEFDPDHVELRWEGPLLDPRTGQVVHQEWGLGLRLAEGLFGAAAVWVCPD